MVEREKDACTSMLRWNEMLYDMGNEIYGF